MTIRQMVREAEKRLGQPIGTVHKQVSDQGYIYSVLGNRKRDFRRRYRVSIFRRGSNSELVSGDANTEHEAFNEAVANFQKRFIPDLETAARD